MKVKNIYRVTILSVTYKVIANRTICTIKWVNNITYGEQKSVGIARWNEVDKYNEEIGRRIAESRAKQDMYLRYSDTLTEEARKIAVKHNKMYVRECKHELKLLREL